MTILELKDRYPNHSTHQDEVFGVPVLVLYTIYAATDPTWPELYIEDMMIYTAEGIQADWVPDTEVKRIEDNIFAARGKRYGG
jgi:hypothetical protein